MSTPTVTYPIRCPAPETLEKLLREELDPTEVEPVEQHIGACPGCQQVLNNLLGSLPDTLLPQRRNADEEPPDLPGYTPLGRIDAGGMGVVWRVRDRQFGRDLAVKVMASRSCHSPHLIERFFAEARICAQLAHPFIVPVHTMNRLADGRPYYTMKLVEGRTLAALLEGGPAPMERRMEFVQIFDKVCQAAAFAHGRGVIHRDLKPENVMVGAHGEVQLMDWGLAKQFAEPDPPLRREDGSDSTAIDPGGEDGARTRAGSVLGTAAYMAPEQAQGLVEEVDRQSDVFGLGGILCRILTGQPPYTGSNAEAVRRRAAEADLDEARNRLRGCGADSELIQLAEHCLAPRKTDRPADAGAVASRLTSYQAEVRERLRQAELERTAAQARAAAERTARRRTRALAAALMALVILAAGGGLWAQRLAAQRRAEQARQESALREEVAVALGKVIRFREVGDFAFSRQLLEQTERRLADGGPDDLRSQVEQCRADTALAQRLDNLRQETFAWVKSKPDFDGMEKEYAAALEEAGLGREDEVPEAVGARVRASAVRVEVVIALDDWAGLTRNDARRAWLLAVARAADPDPDRDRLRQPELWRDPQALMRLAQSPASAQLSPQLLIALARVVGRRGGDFTPLLQAAQPRHPDDFWLNIALGQALSKAKRLDESIGYYRAALALRPRSATVHTNLGSVLGKKGQATEANRHFEEALTLDPTDALAHFNLGIGLLQQGRMSAAIRHFQQAVSLDPTDAVTHCNLGIALLRKGRFEEALTHLQQGHDLGSKKPEWPYPSEQWVRHAQRMLRLDRKLPAILKNQMRPADADEQLGLAEVCTIEKRYAAAARFFADAFAARPSLADAHRYNAACVAALAGCGQGQDTAGLSDAEKARLRRQGRDWLDAELAVRIKQFDRDRRAAEGALRHWLKDNDLAGVRDSAALSRIPEEERRQWRSLWQRIEQLLAKPH